MKQIKLTKKQELVLNYIKEYTAEHGFPPAVREIAKGVGLNSPSSVHSHIKRLERDGFIKKTNSKFRTLEVVGINEFKVNNTEAVSLKIKKCQNNNVLTVGDEKFNIHTTPKCAEYSFVLLAFLKDCDAYRIKYIMRNSYSNERYNITSYVSTTS